METKLVKAVKVTSVCWYAFNIQLFLLNNIPALNIFIVSIMLNHSNSRLPVSIWFSTAPVIQIIDVSWTEYEDRYPMEHKLSVECVASTFTFYPWSWMWAFWYPLHRQAVQVLCVVTAQGGGWCETIHTVKIAVHSAGGCCTATTMTPSSIRKNKVFGWYS